MDGRDMAFGIHFLTGGLLIQEEAAMMAVAALQPQPGDRVLDLCAAPGNKSVQLADAVGPNGWVVANDVSSARLNVLRGMADRFALPNLSITVHDGASFPDRAHPGTDIPIRFDATLVDVPCSCEGTSRKNPSVLSRSGDARRDALPSLQESLLRRAIHLTRPGGRILYATCTFAPEENEMVVNRVLDAPLPGDEVRVLPISIPGTTLDPGITRWGSHVLDQTLEQTARIWPDRNDTGGFYLALLQKSGDSTANHDWPTPSNDSLDASSLPWSAYDLPDSFLKSHCQEGISQKHTRLATLLRPDIPFNEIAVGMSGVNLKSREPRPTSSLASYLAPAARAGVSELAPAACVPFLCRETVEPLELLPPSDRTRYVLVRSGKLALGLGHVDPQGRIESLFPAHLAGLPVKQWLERLREEGP